MCVGVLLATTQYLVAIVPARWFLWRLLGGFSALFNSQTHLYVHACTSYLLDYFLENSIDSYVLVLLSRMNTWSHWKSCLQGWNHLLKRCMVMLASFPDLKNIKGFRNEASANRNVHANTCICAFALNPSFWFLIFSFEVLPKLWDKIWNGKPIGLRLPVHKYLCINI